MRACVGEEAAEKGERRDCLATELSYVCLRYQLEDDGRLKLGEPKATARLWLVSGRKRQARTDSTASISQRSTAQRRWKDLLETELEKQRCKNDERKVCNRRGILPKVKRENDRGNTP